MTLLEEILGQLEPDQAYFWATHRGTELDLLLFKNGRRLGVEIKHADAPTLMPSIRSALADLKLEQLIVLYPFSQARELEPRGRVLPINALGSTTVESLFPAHEGEMGSAFSFAEQMNSTMRAKAPVHHGFLSGDAISKNFETGDVA